MRCPKCKLENPEGAERCDCGYDFIDGKVRKSYLQEDGLGKSKFVGFWKRCCAALIDGLILMPLFLLLNKIQGFQNNLFLTMLSNLVGYSYYIFFCVKYGGTLGKLVMKIKIINEDGNYISLKQSIIRILPQALSQIVFLISKFKVLGNGSKVELTMVMNIVCCISALDAWVIVFNKKRRAIHDYLAGTFVVNRGASESIRTKDKVTVKA